MVLPRKVLVEDRGLGVSDVQIARRLWREARDHLAVLGVLQTKLEGRVGGAGGLHDQQRATERLRTLPLPRWARSAWADL